MLIIIVEYAHRLWYWVDWGRLANFALVGASIYTYYKVLKPLKIKLSEFFEDWFGERDRPGIVPRQGVMRRMEAYDSEFDRLITGEIEQNRQINSLRQGQIDIISRLDRLERMMTPVATYVKDQTGELPRQAPASSQS